jgi:hypothetical protein
MDGFKLDELYWVGFLILVMCLLDRYFYQVLSCLGLLLSSTIAYFLLNHRNEIDVNTFISFILMELVFVWMTIKCLTNLIRKKDAIIEDNARHINKCHCENKHCTCKR